MDLGMVKCTEYDGPHSEEKNEKEKQSMCRRYWYSLRAPINFFNVRVLEMIDLYQKCFGIFD